MGAVSRVFADLSWRRGLCAKKPRGGIANGGGDDRRSTQEGARRGKAAGLRGSAAVQTRWVSGTERCPFDFAAAGGCKGGGLGVEERSFFVLNGRSHP